MNEETEAPRRPLLHGYLTREQVLLETGWRAWTLGRYERERGLPVIRLGAVKLYPERGFREWLSSFVSPAT
jgi:hypothetical protein